MAVRPFVKLLWPLVLFMTYADCRCYVCINDCNTNAKLVSYHALHVYRMGQKMHAKFMAIILSNRNQFCNKFAVEWLLRIPPHIAYVAILPCETLMLCVVHMCRPLRGEVNTDTWKFCKTKKTKFGTFQIFRFWKPKTLKPKTTTFASRFWHFLQN